MPSSVSLFFVRICVCDWRPRVRPARRVGAAWGPAVRRRKPRPRPRGEEGAVGAENFSRSDWGHRCDRRNVAIAAFRPRAADWSLRWQSAELGSVTQAHTVWLSGGFLCLEIAGRDWDFGFLRLTRRRTELRSSSSWRRKLGFCAMGRRPVRSPGAAGVSADVSGGLSSKRWCFCCMLGRRPRGASPIYAPGKRAQITETLRTKRRHLKTSLYLASRRQPLRVY